jgi:hypothetical protein
MTRPPVQVRDAAVAEARRAHGHGLNRPVLVVLHEQAERRAVDLLGEDQQRTGRLHQRVERGHQVVDVGDRIAGEQDRRVLEHRLHPLGVLDQVRREVTVLDLHPLDELDLDPGQRHLLERDHSLGADVVQRLGDGAPDPLVLLGGDRRHVDEVVAAGHLAGATDQFGDDGVSRVLDAAAQEHRVGALGQGLHALADDRLGEQRRGRRPVPGEV